MKILNVLAIATHNRAANRPSDTAAPLSVQTQ